ncbi:unnamed protein product [Brachionus calyciflorus]|uniref:Reverse transcriptase/retrotransposon-derived protein RNase H-like domain-containing protein n=1 Tax=Brachionus calyciflorus TaxID=104777 RepID=A0A814GHB3_9BILA|nr:unnamed protein product [Brachionus calyciflorus]
MPNFEQPFILSTDASEDGNGAVLEQIIDGQLRPIGFFSKNYTATQKEYSTSEKEMLALVMGIEYFHQFLYDKLAFAYNTSVPSVTKQTPFEIMFGRRPRPIDLIIPNLEHLNRTPILQEYKIINDLAEITVLEDEFEKIEQNVPTVAKNYLEDLKSKLETCYEAVRTNRNFRMDKAKLDHDRKIRNHEYKIGDYVLTDHPKLKKGHSHGLAHKYHGPFVIVGINENKVDYFIRLANSTRSKIVQVHKNRLKFYFHSGPQLGTIKDERDDNNVQTKKRKYNKDPYNPRWVVNSRKNDEEDIEINSDSQSESSTLSSSHSNNEHEKISSSSKQMDSQIHCDSSSIESKTKQVDDATRTSIEFEKFINKSIIKHQLEEFLGLVKLVKMPVKSKNHSGDTYQLFLRLEKSKNHIGAAEIIDNLKFFGFPISVKINTLPSDESQWMSAYDEYRKVNLYSEKIKLIRTIAEQTNKNNENQKIGELTNEINRKDELIKTMENDLEMENSKNAQLNFRLEKLEKEKESNDDANFKINQEQAERIRFLNLRQNHHQNIKRPHPTNRSAHCLEMTLEAKDKQIQCLEETLKRESAIKQRKKRTTTITVS